MHISEIKVGADECLETKIGHCLIFRRIKNKRLLALRIKDKRWLAFRIKACLHLEKLNKSALPKKKSAMKQNKSVMK